MEKLHGTLLATSATLHGTMSVRSIIGAEIYDGEYTVHSQAYEVQTLPTANKRLLKNITVEKIPYYETSNLSDGITIYIGDEREVEIYG